MKIISYNVNGIRAAQRKGLENWLGAARPDVLCLQETKAQPEQVNTEALEKLGYRHYWHSAEKKGYSGVALLTQKEPQHVAYGSGMGYIDQEGRIIRADFADISVMSVYIPSGTNEARQSVKMRFLADFQGYIKELRKEHPNLIISGDYNICHQAIDIHDPVRNKNTSGFLPEEREWVSGFLENGFVDSFRHFNPEPHQYSWWSYRANSRARNKGWRLDYNMVSCELEPRIQRANLLTQAHHSDHCPAMVEIKS